MDRRQVLASAALSTATALTGCLGSTGDGDQTPVKVVNERSEAITVAFALTRLGDLETQCHSDTLDEPVGETVTVKPGERAELATVSETGVYGLQFDLAEREIETCLSYDGTESDLAFVVAETVNFVEHEP
jgi:hypothetical protein